MSMKPCSSMNSAVWKPSGSSTLIVSAMVRGTGEADLGARLGDDHVAEHGEAGGDAAGGGVGQDGDEQAVGLVEPGQGGGGLGHLAERDDPLVHAGPAGAAHDDQRQGLLHRLIDGDAELLADDGSHGAHEEVRLHDARG